MKFSAQIKNSPGEHQVTLKVGDRELILYVDSIAEIQNTLRVGTSVRMEI